MFCNKCGKELPDDAEFCIECGVRIVRREAGKAQIKAAKKATKKVAKKAPVEISKEAPVESAVPVESVEPGLKKKSNGAKWWIFGGAAAILVVVAVLLVVILGGKGKLFGGQDGLTEEMAAGSGDVQADGSGETAGVGDAQTDGSEATTKLSLCFREVIYKAGLPDAKVFLTSGYDNPDGEIVAEFTTQPDGTVQTELAAGEYTLCWEAGDYYSGHENLTVNGPEISVVKHMLPVLTEQKAYILIEWDSDRDLDLCVFNAQTKQYINIASAVDDAGNFLYYDNSGADGFELIYLSDYTAGIYTVYVRDGESLLQGTGSSMEAEGLTVSIYTADGLLYRERASTAESAALWSPVYLYQGEAIGLSDSDCYIYDMTNYAWAVRDKGEVAEVPSVVEIPASEETPVVVETPAVVEVPNLEAVEASEEEETWDHVMNWKDPNLEAAMRKITGITEGNIMLSDVWEIQKLNLSGRNISNISALSELTNLQMLNLSENYHISDISALSGLTNLQELHLYCNEISDISALRNLTNLQELNLGHRNALGKCNSISDISALSGLTNLQKLDLTCNNISDISALSGLTNLKYLYLRGNNINDISTLSGLTNLQGLWLGDRTLSTESNNVSDISALSGLTNLDYLDLSNNNVSDISALSGLTSLHSLYLKNNNISDFSALSGLTNLYNLQLWGNNSQNYSCVSFVPNLNRYYY